MQETGSMLVNSVQATFVYGHSKAITNNFTRKL